MCKCFDELKEKIEIQIKEKIENHTEYEGNWKNSVFFFGENPPSIPVVVPFEYSYRSVKTNGEPYKNKTTSIMNVTMSFCPFCGESTNL